MKLRLFSLILVVTLALTSAFAVAAQQPQTSEAVQVPGPVCSEANRASWLPSGDPKTATSATSGIWHGNGVTQVCVFATGMKWELKPQGQPGALCPVRPVNTLNPHSWSVSADGKISVHFNGSVEICDNSTGNVRVSTPLPAK